MVSEREQESRLRNLQGFSLKSLDFYFIFLVLKQENFKSLNIYPYSMLLFKQKIYSTDAWK